MQRTASRGNGWPVISSPACFCRHVHADSHVPCGLSVRAATAVSTSIASSESVEAVKNDVQRTVERAVGAICDQTTTPNVEAVASAQAVATVSNSSPGQLNRQQPPSSSQCSLTGGGSGGVGFLSSEEGMPAQGETANHCQAQAAFAPAGSGYCASKRDCVHHHHSRRDSLRKWHCPG